MLVFCEAFYFEKNQGVRQAVLEGQYSNGEDHFRRVGRDAGLLHRWVDPRSLDEVLYRVRYPEVDAAIRSGEFASAVEHWVAVGNQESRCFFLRPAGPTGAKPPRTRFVRPSPAVTNVCRVKDAELDRGTKLLGGTRESRGRRRRLVFMASVDYANIMTQWARAIQNHSSQLDAVSVCLRPHRFGYDLAHDLDLSQVAGSPKPEGYQLEGITVERLAAVRDLLESADCVVQADELGSHEIMDLFSRFTGVNVAERLTPQQIAIYHAGTSFRKDSTRRNARDAGFLAQLTHPDLFRLGGANARPVFPVLESIPSADEIRHRFRSDHLTILHSPSKPEVKGTTAIRAIIRRLQAALPERTIEYREFTNVSNRVIVDQKRLAHIHIDQFNDLGDQGVGCIGISAFEGWMAGNVILSSTNHILPTVWRAWGIDPESLPLIDLGTDLAGFFDKLMTLCRRPNHELGELAVAQGRTAHASFAPSRISGFFDELFESRSVPPDRGPAVHTRPDKAVVVYPRWLSPGIFHKDRYAEMLRSAFDAELLAVDDEGGLYERVMALAPRLVVTMNLPLYQTFSDQLIHQLPPSVRLVTWHDDLRRQMHPNLPAVLSRSDAVISVLRHAVTCVGQFPDLEGKLWRLPWFVPSAIPPYEINRDPIRRCLIPGEVKRLRPLRAKAVLEIPTSLQTRLEHPGYGKPSYENDVLGKDFYNLIHGHACCLTDASVYRYVVAKYVEVPYTGSLLIAEVVPDLAEMGYRAGEHFLAVDQGTDLGALVADVREHLDDYHAIRKAGQWLVRDRHTEVVRTAEARGVAREIRRRLGLR